MKWLKRPFARMIERHCLPFFYMTEVVPNREGGFRFNRETILEGQAPKHSLGSFYRLRATAMDTFKKAGYPAFAPKKRPELWHPTGTARIGFDPSDSVLDANGAVHGIKNLYAVDASSLPTAGAINTALTIIALALRTADKIERV